MIDKLIMEQVTKECLIKLSKMKQGSFVTKVETDDEGMIFELRPIPMLSMDLPGYLSPVIKEYLKDYDEEIKLFVKAYLLKTKDYQFIQKDFDDLYSEYQHMSEEKKYLNRTLALLHGYKLAGGKPVEIDDLVIRKLDNESAEYLYNHVYEAKVALSCNTEDVMSLMRPKPTLIVENKTYYKDDYSKNMREDILNLGKAIILTNGVVNKVGFSPAVIHSYFKENYAKFFFPEFQTVNFAKPVELKNIEDIRQVYRKLKLLDTSVKFIPIERIYSAHNKVDLEDKFIDLMIALEAAYPSVSSENVYRVSLYTTKLLNGDKEMFDQVKKLYGVRSNIVHGNPPGKGSLSDYLAELESIVLKVSLKGLDYIIQKKTMKDMERDINTKIFG